MRPRDNASGLSLSLDHPAVPAVAASLLYTLFALLLLAKVNGDASRLIVAGDFFVDAASAPASLSINEASYGYDGQFYFRLALDPFTASQTDFGISIDAPAFRHQRILLPLAAWLVTGGDAARLPWVILMINLVCIGMLAWAAGALAKSAGLHALWGLLPPLYPGLVLSLARSLTEIVELSLLGLALLMLSRSAWVRAGCVLSLAVLARETAILAAAGVFAAWVFGQGGRGARGHAWAAFGLPLLAFLGWQSWLAVNWGTAPVFSSGAGSLVAPFTAFWRFWSGTTAFDNSFQVVWFTECVYLVLLALLAAVSVSTLRTPLWLSTSWLLYAALAASLGPGVWVEDWSYLRVLGEYGVIALLLVLQSGLPVRATALVSTGACWLLVAGHVIVYR